ncbi:MAG: alpha/beta hydrolase [Gammaproteobacteria bacterium]|nr:alpha/beta hydrolase [Gammaproteobacteria bacterium]
MGFLKTSRLEVFVEERGQGEAVLYISGTGADLRARPNVLDGVLPELFRVIAYDQRGLGQTEKPLGSYSMIDYAEDAISLLDRLDILKINVVGVSFGGMVAQHLAARFPERVKKLVLCCTSPGGNFSSYPFHRLPREDSALERGIRLIEISDVRHSQAWQKENPDLVKKMIGIMKSRLIEDHESPGYKRGYHEQLNARARHDVVDQLGLIRAETLICSGRYDGIAPISNQKVLEEGISGSRHKIYEGGHLFMIQDPAAWQDIVEFLST